MELKRDNPKAFETLALKLKALDGIEAKVGWFETAKYPDGTPVAYAAALNELGHGKTPPRPFMRPTVIQQKAKWLQQAIESAKAILSGKATPETIMEKIGQQAEADVAKTITQIYAPALSPITIELRAMKMRDPNLRITGATVGEAARRVQQPGYKTPNVSTKPLNDTGLMLATLTHIVEKK